MQCPRDQSRLRTVTRRKTTFDVCDSCHGRWLDAGELEQLVLGAMQTRTSAQAVAESVERIERPIPFRVGADAELSCPRCGIRMKKVRFDSRGSEVVADRCETCAGLWLDAGEQGAMLVFIEQSLPIRPVVAIVAVLLLIAAGAIAYLR
jgi:Zn-finger nucleic acid-binding protein